MIFLCWSLTGEQPGNTSLSPLLPDPVSCLLLALRELADWSPNHGTTYCFQESTLWRNMNHCCWPWLVWLWNPSSGPVSLDELQEHCLKSEKWNESPENNLLTCPSLFSLPLPRHLCELRVDLYCIWTYSINILERGITLFPVCLLSVYLYQPSIFLYLSVCLSAVSMILYVSNLPLICHLSILSFIWFFFQCLELNPGPSTPSQLDHSINPRLLW